MRRALLSRLAVASSAVVAVLAACEIALRVYVASAEDTGKTVVAEPAKLMRAEQRTGWLPNEGARVEKRDANGSPYVGRINSTGQRGPEVPRRRLGERPAREVAGTHGPSNLLPSTRRSLPQRLAHSELARGNAV